MGATVLVGASVGVTVKLGVNVGVWVGVSVTVIVGITVTEGVGVTVIKNGSPPWLAQADRKTQKIKSQSGNDFFMLNSS